MEDPSSPGPETRPDSASDGFAALGAGALASFLDHLEARADLFRWEAREARSRILRRVLAVLAGGFFLLVAHLLIMLALMGWIAAAVPLAWPVAALVVGAAHLLVGGLLIFLARRSRGAPLFPDSASEFRRDREALRRRAASGRPR